MKHGWEVLFLLLSSVALAQTARPYPGAKIDDAATSQARAAAASDPGVEVTVYTTNDDFEKVYKYFKSSPAKEYKVIGARTRKLPTGQEMKDAFFILDDAATIVGSKKWIKIQRPYIGQFGLAKIGARKEDVRDVTAVVLTKSK